jgi:predicted nuclease with TOPRIM domain
MPPKFIGRFSDSDMPESITQPAPGCESLESVAAGEDNSRMSEEITRGLPQDGVERILARLDSIDARLDNIENRLTNVENRLSAIEGRVDALEDKVDRRLQETRPIWEQVLVRLDGVESGFGGMESRFGGLESGMRKLEGEVTGLREEVRTGFHGIEKYLLKLSMEVIEVRGDQRDLEKRMDELETKTT